MVVAAFSDFMQQVVSGLASGGIYALLALALVIIHRSTGVINFAQGEMATLSTYIAWALINVDPAYARIVRTQTLSLRHTEFILAERSL